MITFERARRLAEQAWPESGYAGAFPTMEPFEAGPGGFEDARSFRIFSAKPAVDDAGVSAMDVPVVFVSKETGDVTFEPIIMHFARINAMTPVGEPVDVT